MGLYHEFGTVELDSYNIYDSDDTDFVKIPDFLIQYMGDSLQWILSSWNDEEIKKGISYYGFSIVQGSEIVKLRDIIDSWMNLFQRAPSEFYLTGNYLIDEREYDKILVDKEMIIEILNQWKVKCELAIQNEWGLVHKGI